MAIHLADLPPSWPPYDDELPGTRPAEPEGYFPTVMWDGGEPAAAEVLVPGPEGDGDADAGAGEAGRSRDNGRGQRSGERAAQGHWPGSSARAGRGHQRSGERARREPRRSGAQAARGHRRRSAFRSGREHPGGRR